MIPAFFAALFFATAAFFLHAVLVRPTRPLPAEVDGVYLMIPAMACLLLGGMATALALGASWADIRAAIVLVVSNMFAIV